MNSDHAIPTRPIDRQPLPVWPLSLVILRSSGLSRRVLPRCGTLQIGRDALADIQIDDDGVSRSHARIEISDRVRVVDLGSRNGTRVGNRRLRPDEPVELSQEEAIEIGGTLLLVHVRGSEPTRLRDTAGPAQSAAMQRARALCDHAADQDDGVVIVGESGAGKTGLARMIHGFSRRRSRPFEVLDCAAGPTEHLALRLFGSGDTAGAFELARGGTLMLRHIGGLPDPLQARMIETLDAGLVTRSGRTRAQPIDVRVIATSRDPVAALLGSGQVRRDLMFRLSRTVITVPPLRERGTELSALLTEAVRRHALAHGRPPIRASTATIAAAQDYEWPGNLRELDARVAQAVVDCDADTLRPEHFTFDRGDAATTDPPGPNHERLAILDALTRCAGNQSQAATLLGISRRTLVSRLSQYGIPRPRDRPTCA